MADSVRNRIHSLLDALKADHPRRQKDALKAMRDMGIEGTYDLEISPPARGDSVPTFDKKVVRPLSPMLKARFDYAGSWLQGLERWLSLDEAASLVRRREVRSTHRALRENYEGSAPMLFPDNCLGLFSATDGVPEDLTYLVWATDRTEPEVWEYSDYSFHRSKDLEQYLIWRLKER